MTTWADVILDFCDDHSDDTLGSRRDPNYQHGEIKAAGQTAATPKPKS